jgi:hypothetical protein
MSTLAGQAVSHGHLEWWVPVMDGDGSFDEVAVSVGAGYTAVSITSGYYRFPDFLDALLVALNDAATCGAGWRWAPSAA